MCVRALHLRTDDGVLIEVQFLGRRPTVAVREQRDRRAHGAMRLLGAWWRKIDALSIVDDVAIHVTLAHARSAHWMKRKRDQTVGDYILVVAHVVVKERRRR